MRRIALISEHASPLALAGGVDSGGQNIYVAHLARQLTRNGWRVDVFTRRDRSLLPQIVNWQRGLRVIHVPAGPARCIPKEELLPHMDSFGTFLMDHFASGEGYDLVHANFFMSGLAALMPARACGIPLVMTFHALGKVRRQYQCEADRFPDERFQIEADLVRAADRIIAECPQDRSDLVSLYDADPTRIDMVPCGFDPQELPPMDRQVARAALGWPAREFCVLQLGRLVPRKGIDNVIRAIALLRERHGVHARLYVVGGNSELPNELATPEIARLRGIARELDSESQVSFVGRRGRELLSRYYSAADVFVTTPWYEPFGITPVEAMACGTPVIGADVGGIRYSVAHGRSGYLVPPQDPAALAGRLAELWADAAVRRHMGEEARRRAYRLFTWKRVAAQVGEIYESLLGTRAAERTAERAASGEVA